MMPEGVPHNTLSGVGPVRLHSQKYKCVFDSGNVLRGRMMTAWMLQATNAGRRVGVVVSKKTFHDAVDRNHAKRILREAFRSVRGALKQDVDMVLAARSGIAGKKTADVARELLYLARKGGVARCE